MRTFVLYMYQNPVEVICYLFLVLQRVSSPYISTLMADMRDDIVFLSAENGESSFKKFKNT